MWLGEQITERGIGNGMSLIIFAGIVAGAARRRLTTFEQCGPADGPASGIVLLLLLMVVVAAIVFVERGHRRVTVQYAKRVVGRRMYGGREHAHPAQGEHGRRHPGHLRVVDPGVSGTLQPMFPPGGSMQQVSDQLTWGCRSTTCSTWRASSSSATSTPRSSSIRMTWRRTCGSTAGSFRDPARQADGGAHRHDPDADHARRRDLPGARRAAAGVPDHRVQGGADPVHRRQLDAYAPRFITEGLNLQFYFGGTSLLIIVGVAMDTVQQVESQLIMRHYDGFMKKTRIRGRRGSAEPGGADGSERRDARPPGAGKGTQAERLARRAAAADLDRRHPARGGAGGTPLGSAAQGGDGRRPARRRRRDDRHRAGAAGAPDDAAGVRARRLPADGGAGRGARRMLDGRGPLVVVDIEVPEDVLVERLSDAPDLRKCGATPACDRACERCGGDARAARRRRRRRRPRAPAGLRAPDGKPLVDYYRRGDVPRVDGDQTPDVVTARSRRGGLASRGGVRCIVCKSAREIERMRRPTSWWPACWPSSPRGGAGRDDGGSRSAGRAARARGGRRAGVQGVSRVSRDALRVDQRRGRARDPVGALLGGTATSSRSTWASSSTATTAIRR